MTRRLNFPVRDINHWAEKVQAYVADKPYRDEIKIEVIERFPPLSDTLMVLCSSNQDGSEKMMFSVSLDQRTVVFWTGHFFHDYSGSSKNLISPKMYSFDLLYVVLDTIKADLTLHATKEGNLNHWWVEDRTGKFSKQNHECVFKLSGGSIQSFPFQIRQPIFKRITL